MIALLIGLRSSFRSQAELQVEIAALHHQLAVLQRRPSTRPRLRPADRFFWTWLSRLRPGWRRALVIVQPETVLGWHRRGFRLYWRWKSRKRGPGRPKVSPGVRALIRKISLSNPGWGAPRIHGELLKLGIDVGETSVGKYMVRHRKPPSQTWRTFLENHLQQLVAVDFFVVPTLTFRILFVFVVLAHDRRRILHCNLTAHPTAEWTGAADPRRVSGPCDRFQRTIATAHSTILRRLPSVLAHAPGAGQGRADHEESPASKTRSGDRDSRSGRTAPSLRAASSLRRASRD